MAEVLFLYAVVSFYCTYVLKSKCTAWNISRYLLIRNDDDDDYAEEYDDDDDEEEEDDEPVPPPYTFAGTTVNAAGHFTFGGPWVFQHSQDHNLAVICDVLWQNQAQVTRRGFA